MVDDKDKNDSNGPILTPENEMIDFKERLKEARKRQSGGENSDNSASPVGQAMRMGLELVSGVAVGGFIGYMADQLFGTLPLMLIILVLLGFGAGIRNVIRVAKSMQYDDDAN